MRFYAVFVFLTSIMLPSAGAQEKCTSPRGIFSSSDALQWELRADFSTINDSAIPLGEKSRARSDGLFRADDETFPVRISARGVFRYEECAHRPLAVAPLDEKNIPGAPFDGDRKIKLATICTSYPEYREQETRKLLKEYTIYRMLRHLPGEHLAARLVSLRLVNLDGSLHLAAPAFVRESVRALARRCDLREREPVIQKWNNSEQRSTSWLIMPDRSLRPYDYLIDPSALFRLEFTNRFLNNPDYEIESDHNVIPLASKNSAERKLILIPYDFDLAQLAGGTYYSYTGTAANNADKLRRWLLDEAGDVPLKEKAQVVTEFVAAAPAMREEILSSPLDPQGKAEMTAWLSAHLEVLRGYALSD